MKSFLLIGLGRFGKHMAVTFNRLGQEVMAVDRNEECVNEALSFVTDARIGDSTNEIFLKSLGVPNFDMCIVAVGDDFKSSIETTSLLKDLGAKKIASRATSDVHEKLLLQSGADEVLYPERQLGRWAAIRYSSDNILDFVELDDSHAAFEVPVPSEWAGRSIGSIDIRRKHNINVMAVRNDGQLDVSVTPDTILKKGGSILVLGEYRNIQKCFHLLS